MSDYRLKTLQRSSRGPATWLVIGIGTMFMVRVIIDSPRLGIQLITGIVTLALGIMLFFGLNGTLSFRRAIPVLFVAAILFPFIRLPGDIPDIRPEYLIVVAAWGLLLLSHLTSGLPIRIRRCPSYKWFGLFGLSILSSMAYAEIVKNHPFIGRDFLELVKAFLYCLIFAFITSSNIKPIQLKHYYRVSLVILMLSALFGFMQYFDFASVNQILSPYYAPTQMRGLLVHGRITGTTPNPNEFGALMVLAISLAIAGGLFFREQKIRLLCWLSLPIFGLALVLTMSRSSLVATTLAVGSVILLYLRQRGLKLKWNRVALLMVFILMVVFILLQLAPEKAVFRYSQLAHFTDSTSWIGRVENWMTHFALWKESPWFGWGPGKATMDTIVDNEWLLLARRYGIIGLAVFSGLFGSLFFGLSHIRRTNTEPSIIALTVALQGAFLGFSLYMALASIYHSLQIMPVFLLFLGLAYSQYGQKREARSETKVMEDL